MLKRSIICCFYLFSLLACCFQVSAQSVSLRRTMSAISEYNSARNPEKIFIHTDKSNYNKEDTLWFKAYVFDATLAATSKSGLMYIEIANANNRVVNRNMVRLAYGVGWGNVALTGQNYPEGTYTIRAYTNWQRNFDEKYVYARQFTIEGTLDENWMINSRFELTDKEGVSNVNTKLAFVKNNGSRMFAEELRVRITDGNKLLHYYRMTTGADGTLDFDFNLRDKVNSGKLNMAITKKTKDNKDVTFNVPVIINRDEKTDLQFMPEGGNLIAGLINRVAFKTVNEEGNGIDVQGAIYNGANQKIIDIGAIHKGMGTFEFTPQTNQSYTAKIDINGQQLSYLLPSSKPSGMVMWVDNISNKDSVIILIKPTNDLKKRGGSYYLIGQSRNVVCYGAGINLNKAELRFGAPRSAFPTGIARFTILSQQNQPIAERVVYVNHHDQIKLNIQPSKSVYANRDSVNLDITATDKDGNPVEGSFSIAITDDAQARPDTTGDYNMPVKLLLTDDLKGFVENPGWYFAKGDTLKKALALDALMLTQGWVQYNWDEVFAEKQKQIKYQAEPEFVVKGRVVNAFSKPIEKSSVVLLSLKPVFALDTTTNAQGEFEFKGIYPPDTVAFNLQARNKRGRIFNVGIEMADFTAPNFGVSGPRFIPFYVNIDTSRLKAMRLKQMYNEEEAKITGRQLQEVEIKAKKVVRDSKSLVGAGEADFIMNDEEVKAQPKMSLVDLLKKNIPGFVIKEAGQLTSYAIDNKSVVLIIDGIAASIFMGPGFELKEILAYMDADDVKGIEVMTSGKNQIIYAQKFLDPRKKFWEYAFIELTTYSGGGFSKKIPGAFIYRLPFFASQKAFYLPRYVVRKPVVIPDTRSTIYWAPNVVTNANGKATLSFYTADKTATYTVNVQGADMDGEIGVGHSKLHVKAMP